MTSMFAARPVTLECWPKKMIVGRGGVGALPKVAAELGVKRALVICGKTVASGPLLQLVKAGLGPLYGGVFDEVTSHTPRPMVERALEKLRAADADFIVSVGGGSAIDAGKGTALLHATSGILAPYIIHYAEGGGMKRSLMSAPTIPHIAVPTTAGSASDVMPTAAIRDIVKRQKMLFWDDALVPHAVILDPEMAVHTNPTLTAATGITAIARCIESLYSASRNPLSQGLALHALRLLYRNLPITVAEPGNLEARGACQIAASMSGTASINAMVSIVHALGHVVGGRYALQHGMSHAILLPAAMRQMLPIIGDMQVLVLEAMGGGPYKSADEAGILAAERLSDFVAGLPLQRRLRDIGIPAEDIPEMAEQTTHDYMMENLPAPMSIPDIEALLRLAW
jgi:alcohol dehydrogenase class IV